MAKQITDLLVEPKPWESMPPPRAELFRKPVLEEPSPEMQEILQSQVKHFAKTERRKMVLQEMKVMPEQNSGQIAKKLGLPRGTVIHDIWYLRDTIPELRNFGRLKKNRIN